MQELPLQFKFRWLNDEGQEGLFARKKKGRFDGEIVVGEDGMMFSLPAGSKEINRSRLM